MILFLINALFVNLWLGIDSLYDKPDPYHNLNPRKLISLAYLYISYSMLKWINGILINAYVFKSNSSLSDINQIQFYQKDNLGFMEHWSILFEQNIFLLALTLGSLVFWVLRIFKTIQSKEPIKLFERVVEEDGEEHYEGEFGNVMVLLIFILNSCLLIIFLNFYAMISHRSAIELGVFKSGEIEFTKKQESISSTLELSKTFKQESYDIELSSTKNWNRSSTSDAEYQRKEGDKLLASLCFHPIGNQDEDALLYMQSFQKSFRQYKLYTQECAEDKWKVKCLIKTSSTLPDHENKSPFERIRTVESLADALKEDYRLRIDENIPLKKRPYETSWHWIYFSQCNYCLNYSMHIYFFDKESQEKVSNEVVAMLKNLKSELGPYKFDKYYRGPTYKMDSHCAYLSPIQLESFKFRARPKSGR